MPSRNGRALQRMPKKENGEPRHCTRVDWRGDERRTARIARGIGCSKDVCSDMIFIFSSPRSGSTWLAKAFDSHPDTLYLHEPDIVDRGSDLLPHWFDRDASG